MTIGTSYPLLSPLAPTAPAALPPVAANAPPQPGSDELRLGERPQVLSRSANPLTQMQRDQWAQVGAPHEHDNAGAAEVRSGYSQAARDAEGEADTFTAQGAAAQKAGSDLEALGRQLGNGSHTGPYGDVNVAIAPDGISVTQRHGSDNLSLDSHGHYLNVRNNGVEMTDTPAGRTIRDGDATRTLHTLDSVDHHAGEFEVERDRNGAHDLTRVDGNSIQRDHEGGGESTSSKYSTQSNGTVGYSDYRSRFNRSNRQTTTQFREVQVGPDGGTRTRQNDASGQVSETSQSPVSR